ncbi:hypothetical protein P280DRAFT_475945 [Massarina eburnea CBS 473.64]|uniref:RTA1-domain-containing protein n=1 Tax=Massarina eburnea CBS 473.64 TaxID=1395130 RepID=A0A6A6SCW9_9PLEO|nr:hypothetical protein P280DRAFT_475945 [Massarina eburnea CBS 473.64]
MNALLVLSAVPNGQLPKRDSGEYTKGALLNPYIYDPAIPAAVVGCIVILLLCAALVYQYIRYRSWFFWAALIGILMETIGYVCRLYSAYHERQAIPFLIAFLMILLAPSFLAAACYTAFSRVVWFSCPSTSLNFKTLWCFPRYITPTFVIFDLVSFVVQLVGASQISRHYDHETAPERSILESERHVVAGRVILVLGLIMQLSCYLTFAIIALRYFIISLSFRSFDLGDWKMWRRLSYLINMAAGLITLRAIYRTLEIPHDKGAGLKYLSRHEWCFWMFDALPIALVLAVMVVWFPGRYLPRSYTGLKLDKGRAVQEKDDLGQMGQYGETELREFKPQDFGGGVGMRV